MLKDTKVLARGVLDVIKRSRPIYQVGAGCVLRPVRAWARGRYRA